MKPLSLDEINHLSEVAYLYQPNNDGKQFPRLLDTARLYWAEKEKNQKLIEALKEISKSSDLLYKRELANEAYFTLFKESLQQGTIAKESLKLCGEGK